jgi:hypothetical protein
MAEQSSGAGPFDERDLGYRFTTGHVVLPLSVMGALVALVVICLFRAAPQWR